MEKDLEIGSLVAVNHPQWVGTVPQIGKVTKLPKAGEGIFEMPWLESKRSSKSLLQRTLVPSKAPPTCMHVNNVLLYNFQLNKQAQTLRKTTREELKRQYDELKNGEWCNDVMKRKKKMNKKTFS